MANDGIFRNTPYLNGDEIGFYIKVNKSGFVEQPKFLGNDVFYNHPKIFFAFQ